MLRSERRSTLGAALAVPLVLGLSGALTAVAAPPAPVLAATADSSPGSSEQQSTAEQETLTGSYRLLSSAPALGDENPVEQEFHYLETDAGRVELVAQSDILEDLQPGQEIEVTGLVQEADPAGQPTELQVIQVTPAEEPVAAAAPAGSSALNGPVAGVLPNRTGLTHGPKKTAVILLKKGPSGGTPTTASAMYGAFFSAADSVANHFAEVSWNKTTLIGHTNPVGDVYDYLTIPANTACFGELSAGEAAASTAGINLDLYDYVSFVMDASSAGGCGYGGWAWVGGKENLVLYYDLSATRGIAIHELGHNFGLGHAAGLQCTKEGGSGYTALPWLHDTCVRHEYGDPTDMMGDAYGLVPFSAFSKARLGWIPSTNVQEITTSGDYYVYPNAVQGTNPQLLTVPADDPDYSFAIDFRQPYGQYWETRVSNFTGLTNGVSIRRVNAYDATLIDATPDGSFYNAALVVGQSLTDPKSGVKIETLEANSTRAKVRVTLPAAAYPQVYLRGTHNSWTTSTPMTKVAGTHNSWQATATFGSGSTERFKFDVYGNWATNFGDNAPRDGIGDSNGADIPITQGAGTYQITFNGVTRQYSVGKVPIANAGPDQTVLVNQYFTLDGSASSGTGGATIARYTWNCCTGVNVPDYTLWQVDASTAQYYISVPGVYDATLTVTDSNGRTATDTVRITVESNDPPVAVAGADFTVAANQTFTLDATGSYDPDGTIASYRWTCCFYSHGLYDHFNTSNAVFTYSFPSPGTYTPTLTVTDDDGAQSTDTVTITVTPGSYTSVYPSMYLRGTHNSWGTSTPMTLVANNSWQATATFGSGTQQYKFDVYGNWNTNFGDNNLDGVANSNEGNISITQGAGTYVITFNDSTKAYTAVKQ